MIQRIITNQRNSFADRRIGFLRGATASVADVANLIVAAIAVSVVATAALAVLYVATAGVVLAWGSMMVTLAALPAAVVQMVVAVLESLEPSTRWRPVR